MPNALTWKETSLATENRYLNLMQETLQKIIDAQPEEIREHLEIVRDGEAVTIGRSGCPYARLHAWIETLESSAVTFWDRPREPKALLEGKPVMESCTTEYYVGELEIEIPDEIEIERYF